MIRVLLADDNALIRDGIRLRLRDAPEIDIVGMAGNGKEALELCKKENPDVVLMDINMPNMDGLEATRLIKEHNKDVKVLILTSHALPDNIEKAKNYRCNGFIYKEANLEDLVSVIKSVYKGFDLWSKDLLYIDRKVNISKQEFDSSELEQLTEKEIMLIKCKVKCLTYSEIAKELCYSEAYSRQLAVQLKDKLVLKNVNELAVWGAKRGL